MTAKTIPKIAIEEAFTLPELAYQSKGFTGPNGGKDLATDLLDIQGRRIQRMDDNNVSFMVLSLTSPGPQDQGDAANALDLAQRANNYLAAQIKKKPDRLGGFASLSMHDPKIAATEARRAIEELGLHGIIVNDFQTTNANGNQIVFYDQPEWDHFWEELSRLDVPLYLHPRLTIPSVSEKFLSGRPWLRNSPYFFSVVVPGVSLHVLGMYTNGVFDRWPKLQVVIGHMGEHLPFQLWRIDHRLSYYTGELSPKTTRTLRDVMKTNIHITTSGHYGTPALLYAIEELGIDRVMFSIDYPYDTIEQAVRWFDGITELTQKQKEQLASGNAKRLLKL